MSHTRTEIKRTVTSIIATALPIQLMGLVAPVTTPPIQMPLKQTEKKKTIVVEWIL